ncbi:MAG TPA: DHH family phosphoesterase [Candidatus Cloacimonadota bacterium]|nr:DHH family phosphoesterase [Candidatus Cloacimonadota bacterium]
MVRWKLPDDELAGFVTQLKKSRPEVDLGLDLTLEDLPDEGLFANIEVLADRIQKAMYTNEPLVIFGHDDPDGLTGTYILHQFFNSIGYQKHEFYIPNRNLWQHGIQDDFVEHVRENGFTLAIVVDNGISSREGVERLKRLGCDTLIVDHHLIQQEQLPEAFAIMNPRLPGCRYPFKDLAGVGVVLMLIRHLGKILEHEVDESAYFWTAVGSIADKVPMVGLNRLILRHVIDNWPQMRDASIDFLLRNFKRLSDEMDVFDFITNTSRLIANGREEGGQHMAMRFLLQMGDEKAKLFQALELKKRQWESELNRIFGYMDTILADFEARAFIYFDDEDMIPYNFLGTASTYVVSSLNIPAIMIKYHNGKMVCEGRCPEGMNMVDAFAHCKEHLIQYGGHAKAAGFTMHPDKYDDFLSCYNDYLDHNLQESEPPPRFEVDAVISLEDMHFANWQILQKLLPYGIKNPEPLLLARGVDTNTLMSRFTIEFNNISLPRGEKIDIVFYWKNRQSVRVMDFVVCRA